MATTDDTTNSDPPKPRTLTKKEREAERFRIQRARKAQERAERAARAAAEAAKKIPADQRLVVDVPEEFTKGEPETAWSIAADGNDPTARRYSKSGRPIGRPRKPITIEEVMAAASIQCTDKEIALICHVSERLFARRKAEDPAFRQALEEARAGGKVSLRRKQYKKAVDDGDTQLLIFLGKQYLEQKEQMAQQTSFVDRSGSLLEKLQALEKGVDLKPPADQEDKAGADPETKQEAEPEEEIP